MGPRPRCRLFLLGAFLLAGLLGVAGCKSTTAPASLGGSNPSDPPPLTQRSDANDADRIAWRKSIPATAVAQEHWGAPERRGAAAIRPTAFQPEPLPKVEVAPLPPIMQKQPEVLPMPRQASGKPVLAPHAVPMPMPLPSAPTEQHLVMLPTYVIRPPDVLLIESQKGLLTQMIRGQHLVRPDGTVGIGIYGPAPVAGRTIQQAREEIARVIHARLDPEKVKLKDVLDGLNVDVLAYNSTVYYVVTDGAGLGEAVYRFPITGSETVLDAIGHINGLPVVSSPRRIWVARRNMGVGPVVQEHVLPVDWLSITRGGSMATNWQIMPGDRVFVQADPMRRFNNNLGKYLEPVERLFGASLLAGQTINTIRNGTTVVR